MAAITRSLASLKLWEPLIASSNNRLVSKKLQVNLSLHLPTPPQLASRGFELLEVVHLEHGLREPIDIFHCSSSADPSNFTNQLVRKVSQHIEAKKTPGILISPSGRKLDVRLLSTYNKIHMAEDGALKINDEAILVLHFARCSITEKDKNPISSCTIARAINYIDRICIVDDKDLASNFSTPFPVIINGVMGLIKPKQVSDRQREHLKAHFDSFNP